MQAREARREQLPPTRPETINIAKDLGARRHTQVSRSSKETELRGARHHAVYYGSSFQVPRAVRALTAWGRGPGAIALDRHNKRKAGRDAKHLECIVERLDFLVVHVPELAPGDTIPTNGSTSGMRLGRVTTRVHEPHRHVGEVRDASSAATSDAGSREKTRGMRIPGGHQASSRGFGRPRSRVRDICSQHHERVQTVRQFGGKPVVDGIGIKSSSVPKAP